MAVDNKQQRLAPAAEQARGVCPSVEQQSDSLAKLNATVATLVQRVSRRVRRTARRRAALAGTGAQ